MQETGNFGAPLRNGKTSYDHNGFGSLAKLIMDMRIYSDASQYRKSRDQHISSVIGGFLLLPI